MAGQPIIRAAKNAIAKLGEDEIWLMYLECKTVKKLVAAIEERTGHKMPAGVHVFYKWLDAEEGRRERWAQVKKIRGDLAFDEVEEIADSINEFNVRESEAKIRAKQWIAERLNRSEYGKDSANVNVTINAQNAWLGALKEAERMAPAIQEADYEVVTSGEDSDE